MPFGFDDALMIGGSLLGGIMGGSSANKAAKQQAAAADAAMKLQKKMFDTQRADLEPWRRVGTQGLYSLANLMGLSSGPTRQELVDQYKPQYTRQVAGTAATTGPDLKTAMRYGAQQGRTLNDILRLYPKLQGGSPTAATETTDWTGLNSAVDKAYSDQQAAAAADPNFGFLAKRFGLSDFEAEPGYQFRQSEGEKALARAQAARGNYLSGQAAKEAARFGQNLATEEYGNAYNRFVNDQTNIYNRMAGIAGIGQTATGALGAAAGNYGASVADLLTQQGNARAAGTVGQANAWNDALGGIGSQYNTMRLMDLLRGKNAA